MYIILSIDGGGVRGLVPLRILSTLEGLISQRAGKQVKIGECFDLIAGTSVGGILASFFLVSYFTKPGLQYSAAEVSTIFKRHLPDIFVKTWSGMIWDGPKYSGTGMANLAKSMVGDLKFARLAKPCLIPAYDLLSGRAVFFRHDEHGDFPLATVITGATAAPTYFPPVSVKGIPASTGEEVEYCLTDGGIYVNNPARCAILEAQRITGRSTINDILIISISCGSSRDTYTAKEATAWGKLGWILPVINIGIDMGANLTHCQLREEFAMAGNSHLYHRFDPPLPTASSALDDISVKNIQALESDTNAYLITPEIAKELADIADLIVRMKNSFG
jgi:uncharacterized protein